MKILLNLFICVLILIGCNKKEDSINNNAIALLPAKKTSEKIEKAKNFSDLFLLKKTIVLDVKDAIIGEPTEIRIANNGNILISDMRIAKQIALFDSMGNFIKAIGTHGEGPGEFIEPSCISFDNNNNIIVCDNTLKRITIYNSSGYYLRSFKIKYDIIKIISDTNNRLYCCNAHNNGEKIYIYDMYGEEIKTININSDYNMFKPSYMGGMDAHNEFLFYIGPLDNTIYVYNNSNYELIQKIIPQKSIFSKADLTNTSISAKDFYKKNKGKFSMISDIQYFHPGLFFIWFLYPNEGKYNLEIIDSKGIILNRMIDNLGLTTTKWNRIYSVNYPEYNYNNNSLTIKLNIYETKF